MFVCVSSEERESWIRAKYEQRAFVAPLQPASGFPLSEGSMPAWLLSAVSDRDLPRLLLLLAHSTKEQINAQTARSPSSPHTALHAACQLGDVVMTQLLIWVSFSLWCPVAFTFTTKLVGSRLLWYNSPPPHTPPPLHPRS